MILFHQYPESMDGSSDKTEDFIDRAAAAVPRRMSYELEEQDDWQAALNHPATVTALRISKRVVQGLVMFAVGFVEIVAEVLAPIVLISGIAWSFLPGLLSGVGPEGPARDAINSVVQAVPREIHFGHSVITPGSLIFDGIMLIALVALCRTILAIVNREI